jgi:hypothetical protein
VSKKKKDMWPGMSRKQFDGIVKYIEGIAGKLGLSEWTISLGHEPSEGDDSMAECLATNGRLKATITVASDFNTFTLEDKRRTLIHELLHCHQQKGIELFTADESEIEAHMGRLAWGIMYDAINLAQETMVDTLSVVISRMIDDTSVLKYLERKS